MNVNFDWGFRKKLHARRNRGKPRVEHRRIEKLGALDDEKHMALDVTVHNPGDRELQVISVEVRKVNEQKALQRGTVNESVVEPGDYVETRSEFTLTAETDIQDEENSVSIRLRTECGGQLRTEIISLEDVGCES